MHVGLAEPGKGLSLFVANLGWSPRMRDIQIAEIILTVHLFLIAFNVMGLVVIPIGGWREWRIVRVAWLRLLHLAFMVTVAAQALAGRACILTIWQDRIEGNMRPVEPLIMRSVDTLIYWNLPLWFFTALYSVLLLYVLALIVLVPFSFGNGVNQLWNRTKR